MSTTIKSLNNEYIPDSLCELVDELFENAQYVVISENGMTYEHGFDHDEYFNQFSFADKVEYLLKY